MLFFHNYLLSQLARSGNCPEEVRQSLEELSEITVPSGADAGGADFSGYVLRVLNASLQHGLAE